MRTNTFDPYTVAVLIWWLDVYHKRNHEPIDFYKERRADKEPYKWTRDPLHYNMQGKPKGVQKLLTLKN